MNKVRKAWEMVKRMSNPVRPPLPTDGKFMGTWLTPQEYDRFIQNQSKYDIDILSDDLITYGHRRLSRADVIELATTLLVVSREMGKGEHV